MPESQNCPICRTEVPKVERYPKYVCRECFNRAVDETGRKLKFMNESVWGGYLAFYADTDEKYESHTCFIDGIKCFANEARFGGIVIETVE